MPESRRERRPGEAAASTAEDVLSALDDCGRAFLDERSYFRDALSALLRAGPYTAIRVWCIAGDEVRCEASAPEVDPTTIPAPETLTRVARDESSEILVLAEESGPVVVAGSRLIESEGIVLEASLAPGTAVPLARRLLQAAAESVGHFCIRARYRGLRRQGEAATALSALLARLHGGGSLEETAFTVAECLQAELGYDRSWVCSASSYRCRVLATSAALEVSRRTTLTRLVENVAEAAVHAGHEILWAAGSDPPAAQKSVLQLADEAGARRIRILPLGLEKKTDPFTVVIVLEGFTAELREDEEARTALLRPHAALAMEQAMQTQRRGLRGIWFHLSQSWRWLKGAAIAVVAVIALAVLISPTDFEIEVEGRLMPVNRRSVYAPADGVVAALDVNHDQQVAERAPILTLRDPKLDLDEERLNGELEELRTKLTGLQVLRTQGRRTNSDSPADLSAQEEQLNVAIAGAERQLALVSRQQEHMHVTSPIAGVIDRWDLREALTARPVVRGQHLVDVLDTSGQWELELMVPDKLAGHLLEAKARTSALPIHYVLRTDAGSEHDTQLSSLGERVEIDEQGRPVVRATAILGPSPAARRAGASVIARIDCGRTTRAYAWFYELWDYAQRKWLL
jgi:hypothetical protein